MKKKITYTGTTEIKLRALLQQWLIPKKWQHYLRVDHLITINGKYESFFYDVQPNDVLELNFNFPPRSTNQKYLTGNDDLNIIFEDEDLLILNKPAGQKTHPNYDEENFTLMNSAEAYLSKTSQHPYMIHRIDSETSGLVMVAKNPYIVPILNRQLTRKEFKRDYLSVVDINNSLPDSGRIELPIGEHSTDGRMRSVIETGLDSITEFKVLKRTTTQALLDLKLLTGRTHQIRVHLSHNGWPIIGDPLYNPESTSKPMRLLAYKMSYTEPFSTKKNSVEISIPTEFDID
ncbi:RNA pseudouridine synthase [Companilactobacillus sp. RD055328]|uniref:RluA family pseudouridine synthase n=1 Tax=Companilactobacillus sp. RD055328 TaxID=2916634 RepID=UPI001FC8A776|nr:RluA family pseudouridine synthase [Companilactobacillus sp. RD055328]GKQ42484.1 RNA pseudouridine synthase [Companilactobacillus sp. RD055328]